MMAPRRSGCALRGPCASITCNPQQLYEVIFKIFAGRTISVLRTEGAEGTLYLKIFQVRAGGPR